MSELAEGFVYVVGGNGEIIQRYDYDTVALNGLPCYLWPEDARIIHRPTTEQRMTYLQHVYSPVGPADYA